MKIFVKLYFILIFFFVFSGCTVNSCNKTELTFWTLQLSEFAPYIKKKICEYEKNNPNIKIKWVDVPFSEGEKRTLSAVMSENVPDVINLNPSFASVLQKKKALYFFKDELRQKYIAPALQLCKEGDAFFAIPWYVTSKIIIYNKELLENTGYNTPPKNYFDLLPFSFVIKQKTGKYAFMPNLSEDGAMFKILAKQNVGISDFFSSEKTEKIYCIFKKLYKYDLIPKESINQTHRDSLEKYMAGEILFLQAGANFLDIIKQNASDIYYKSDVSPQLELDKGVVSISLMNLVIPAKSKYKKEALDFAKFITNSKNQLEFCKLAPVLPSAKKSLNDKFFNQTKTLIDKGRKLSAEQLKQAKTTSQTYPNQKGVNELIDETTQKIILEKSSIKEALKQSSQIFDNINQL